MVFKLSEVIYITALVKLLFVKLELLCGIRTYFEVKMSEMKCNFLAVQPRIIDSIVSVALIIGC